MNTRRIDRVPRGLDFGRGALGLGTLVISGCTGIIYAPGGEDAVPRIACQIHHAVCFEASADFTECITPWTQDGQQVFDFQYPYLADDPDVPAFGVPQVPYEYDANAPMSYKPAPAEISSADRTTFGPGDWACERKAAGETDDDVCARLCAANRQAPNTETGRANPAFHAPVAGEPYCVGFQVQGEPVNDLCHDPQERARGTAIAERARAARSPALPGNPNAADLYVSLIGVSSGSNTISIEGATGEIPIVTGYASFKLPDPFCRNTAPCMARLNRLEVRYGDFVYTADGTAYNITNLSVYLSSALDFVVTPVPGSTSFIIEIAAGTQMFVVGKLNGDNATLSVPIPEVGYVTYDPASGIVTADLEWSTTVDGVSIGGTTFVTTASVGNRPPRRRRG